MSTDVVIIFQTQGTDVVVFGNFSISIHRFLGTHIYIYSIYSIYSIFSIYSTYSIYIVYIVYIYIVSIVSIVSIFICLFQGPIYKIVGWLYF